jgi:hypothetical protein
MELAAGLHGRSIVPTPEVESIQNLKAELFIFVPLRAFSPKALCKEPALRAFSPKALCKEQAVP